MAYVINRPNGHKWIQFTLSGRQTIRLGVMTRDDAVEIRGHVKRLVNAKRTGTTVADRTIDWLTIIADELHNKLAAVGLVEWRVEPNLPTVGKFADEYLEDRKGGKARTVFNLKNGITRFVGFLGREKLLRDITPADGDRYKAHLAAEFSTGHASRQMKYARQLIRAAIRAKLLESDPLQGLAIAGKPDQSRWRFIDRDAIERVIEACPNAEWRLIVALSRFAGLRCPSEHKALTWGDVDWNAGNIVVRSPKTGSRIIPLFGDVLPYLRDAWEIADNPTDGVPIIPRIRSEGDNLRTTFAKIIKRAGLTPWPKLFHNLRASCQTEMTETFPMHVTCAWLGNSTRVASEHYFQVTTEHAERARQARVTKPEVNATENSRIDPEQPEREAAKSPRRSESESLCGVGNYARQESNL